MNSEENLVIDIWDIFKDSVSPKQKENKAYLLLKAFVDAEIIEDVASLEGEDDIIDAAIELFKEDLDDDEEYEEYE